MYFFDTGLVSYLTRYSSPEILMNGAINGAILENYVVSEIIKTYSNSAQDCLLHYYRDKNSNEIDLIMESDGQLHPIEIKKASIRPHKLRALSSCWIRPLCREGQARSSAFGRH